MSDGGINQTKTEKLHLLIYAHYYIPDTSSTSQILKDFAEGMLDTFRITVICFVTSYLGTIEDKYKTRKYYYENIISMYVLRVSVPKFATASKKNCVKNIIAYFFRAMKATWRVGKVDKIGQAGKVGKVDYVMRVSQSPNLGRLLGVYGKYRKRAKFGRLSEHARFLCLFFNVRSQSNNVGTIYCCFDVKCSSNKKCNQIRQKFVHFLIPGTMGVIGTRKVMGAVV